MAPANNRAAFTAGWCLGSQVVVYYYLADDTVHVEEPKQDNSGLPQVRCMPSLWRLIATGCTSCFQGTRPALLHGGAYPAPRALQH